MYVDETTVETVRATSRRARENLATVATHPRPELALAVVEPHIWRYRSTARLVRGNSARDAHQHRAALAWTELYAQAASAAATFVAEQVDAV